MKILLFGHQGQLGWELLRTMLPLGEIIAIDYPRIDLKDSENIRSFIRELQSQRQFHPDILVNATAYTAVDLAESEREQAFAINAQAPTIMADEADRLNAAFIHFSTDYVFDGELGRAYVEDDLPNPINVYGESKLAGEKGVISLLETLGHNTPFFIFRTSWVYSLRGDSFVNKVLQWSRNQKKLRLVTDQVSNPTWARFLAEITTQVLAMAASQNNPREWLAEHRGLYHLAGNGWTSRYEWGETILKLDPHPEEQTVESLEPALTSDFPSPAMRPPFTALNCDRFASVFHLRLPGWKEGLHLALNNHNIPLPLTHG
jgi:dTDP-4-dehydrorhamnose reductase